MKVLSPHYAEPSRLCCYPSSPRDDRQTPSIPPNGSSGSLRPYAPPGAGLDRPNRTRTPGASAQHAPSGAHRARQSSPHRRALPGAHRSVDRASRCARPIPSPSPATVDNRAPAPENPYDNAPSRRRATPRWFARTSCRRCIDHTPEWSAPAAGRNRPSALEPRDREPSRTPSPKRCGSPTDTICSRLCRQLPQRPSTRSHRHGNTLPSAGALGRLRPPGETRAPGASVTRSACRRGSSSPSWPSIAANGSTVGHRGICSATPPPAPRPPAALWESGAPGPAR